MKKTLIALPALLVLLLAGTLSAGIISFIGQGKGQFEPHMGQSGDWYPLAIMAVALCFFFNTLVYMAGHALQAENLKKYAQTEFLQVSASSLMILFVISLLFELSGGGAFGLMDKLTGSSGSIACSAVSSGRYYFWSAPDFGGGPIGAFKCKVQEKITALDKQYWNIFNANMGTERLASTCISLFGFPVWCWDWDLSLHKQVEQAHLLCAKITGLLVPLHAQFVLAEYVQKNMLGVFLPLGLLLRIIPVTRGVGGLFIAIAIGFYFVWPTFSVLTDPTFVRGDETRVDDKLAGMCFTGFRGVAVIMNSALNTGLGGGANELANAQGEALLFEITIGSVFYPFIALVITLIFIRAATPLLGGDMGELMRMVARLG
jgi:hypothetical protein